MADDRGNLIDHLAAQIGTTPLTPAEIDSLLDLAAAAAHGTGDRTTAPLASFLAGIAAAKADDRASAVTEIRNHIGEIAPPSDSKPRATPRLLCRDHDPPRDDQQRAAAAGRQRELDHGGEWPPRGTATRRRRPTSRAYGPSRGSRSGSVATTRRVPPRWLRRAT